MQMLQAECRLARKDKRAALQFYQSVSERFPHSRVAEVACVESIKLLTELGKGTDAAREVERYLRVYPQGRFVAEVMFRRCELLIDSHALGDAQVCLEAYRRSDVGSTRRPDAILLLATLARVQQQWRQAADLYNEYLQQGAHVSRAEEALYRRIECLRRGKLGGLDDAIRTYRRRFPNGEHSGLVEGRE